MVKEVFSRYEKKYLINQETYELLLEKLAQNIVEDNFCKKYGFYSISNIYYDTVNDELIRKSIEKPVYKEKLRLRSYGTPGLDDNVFLEVKKKYKGIVNKRRTTMPLYDAYSFIENKAIQLAPGMNKQIINEITYFLNMYEVFPKLYLAYDRRAFYGADDENLRITFDKNIRTRRYDLQLELGDYGSPLIDDELWLMEIKVNYAVPVWLTNIISECNVYSTSFSKYGTEYKQIYYRRGEQTCLSQF